MSARQHSFFKPARKNTLRWWIENQLVYGGSLNYRKTERPFDSKKLVHVVFKAQLGKSTWFTKSQKSILRVLNSAANRYHIKIKSFSIQNDHIHLLIYPDGPSSYQQAREQFQNFLRFFSAEMGRKYKVLFKKFGVQSSKNLWAHRPFTRVVSWGTKSLKVVLKYIQKNTFEALGSTSYTQRNHRLTLWLKKFSEELRV